MVLLIRVDTVQKNIEDKAYSSPCTKAVSVENRNKCAGWGTISSNAFI